ncbi:type I methionyl aminopeptidase [Flavihumibacter petaseus]|uniref:Methionine aminopeptidase n=1 Tax=Flavihumibacter petaseus NBRC 106054 TaxID=1220578 RepID=A0A0E9N6H1_9BACT|nr:type I methionyl aminopeptidase [Flavihumibacter petaseus]GAO44940.1 methionine aminopeptidase [Flavihumibacter petaseus NBRC 106054]
MSIQSTHDLQQLMAVSEAVAETLRLMRDYARPGMDCATLDAYGGKLLSSFGARPAPKITYGFPGFTCISVNHEIAHGIPASHKILQEGDLVNIDVSAEKNGYWADNGGSFVLGEDRHGHQALVEASRLILQETIRAIRPGMRVAEWGRSVERKARAQGLTVIRNLTGHGIGRNLHEHPKFIPNYFDPFNRDRFRKNMVVAVETFISTGATKARESGDGWTLITGDGSFTAQHEHTILVREEGPLVLTSANGN